jgi:O-methyltransferase/aklanonic acid methyltransferase
MTRIWSRPLGVTDLSGPDYWDYFAEKLIQYSGIKPGMTFLDIGCGTGSSLFPAAKIVGSDGFAIGIDICPG